MVFFALATSRAVVGGIAAGAISAAMLFGRRRPGCRGSRSQRRHRHRTARRPISRRCLRVSRRQRRSICFSHPDVNTFFTSLKGQPRSDHADQVKQYMDANPQTHTDLEGIRQPLTDFRNRCNMQNNSEAVLVGRENPASHFFRVLRCGTA